MILLIVRTVVIYVAVIVAMRLMGKRQLGELQPGELVTTFLISNVASICIEEPELPIVSSLVPILLITAMELLSSCAAWKFPAFARLLFGKQVTVIRDGKIDQSALARLRISAGDLMEALRGKDLYSPEEVSWGVIETNGTLNAAPVPDKNAPPPMLPVWVDHYLYRETLEHFSLPEHWLDDQLSSQGLARQDVLILLYNGRETLLIRRENTKGGHV